MGSRDTTTAYTFIIPLDLVQPTPEPREPMQEPDSDSAGSPTERRARARWSPPEGFPDLSAHDNCMAEVEAMWTLYWEEEENCEEL